MGRKNKTEDGMTATPPGAKKTKKSKKRGHSDSEDSDDELLLPRGPDGIELEFEVPPKEILSKLMDQIEAQLPRDDHVKYDSRAKKLDWEKIKFAHYSGEQCKKLWFYIQDRIRRFRILQELIPDARIWISQPWTNFYKSKDHNRHPEMPKKPLSMYMLFYSEKREQILKDQPSLSMPEVAKICSEQYQKLSDKKKAKYKQRCDEMRRAYEEKLALFYHNYPEMKPVKADKSKKAKLAAPSTMAASLPMQPPPSSTPQHLQQQQQQPMVSMSTTNNIPMMTYAQQQAQPQVITIGTGPNQQMINVLPMQQDVYTVVQPPQQQQLAQHQQQFRPPTPPHQLTTLQAPQQHTPQLPTQPTQQMPQQPLQQQQQIGVGYPAAPEKPAKPFDLFFKHQMDLHAGDTNFDRQSYAEQARQEWKNMKLKKKAKWIKKANDNYREYEEKIIEFMAQNPGYVRPQHKNFLTQDDQRILDKYMGRPEKPPSSAYSLFSKEMLNNVEIKKFPSKERMAQISEKWKLLPQEQKDK